MDILSNERKIDGSFVDIYEKYHNVSIVEDEKDEFGGIDCNTFYSEGERFNYNDANEYIKYVSLTNE